MFRPPFDEMSSKVPIYLRSIETDNQDGDIYDLPPGGENPGGKDGKQRKNRKANTANPPGAQKKRVKVSPKKKVPRAKTAPQASIKTSRPSTRATTRATKSVAAPKAEPILGFDEIPDEIDCQAFAKEMTKPEKNVEPNGYLTVRWHSNYFKLDGANPNEPENTPRIPKHILIKNLEGRKVSTPRLSEFSGFSERQANLSDEIRTCFGFDELSENEEEEDFINKTSKNYGVSIGDFSPVRRPSILPPLVSTINTPHTSWRPTLPCVKPQRFVIEHLANLTGKPKTSTQTFPIKAQVCKDEYVQVPPSVPELIVTNPGEKDPALGIFDECKGPDPIHQTGSLEENKENATHHAEAPEKVIQSPKPKKSNAELKVKETKTKKAAKVQPLIMDFIKKHQKIGTKSNEQEIKSKPKEVKKKDDRVRIKTYSKKCSNKPTLHLPDSEEELEDFPPSDWENAQSSHYDEIENLSLSFTK